ncbi:MAG TPA: ferritin family protein [Thermoanaerobaculia bacterium]|nr:ferritin family protein [Thermoanaerobaculia bacterium]
MSQTVDFTRLDLKDALDLAILIEDEARERYEEFAEQMEVHHTSDAAGFYRFMAQNEAKHGEEIAVRRKELFGDAPSRMSRSMLWDVEAPDYDQARAFMTPRRALEVALESETKAHAYFTAAIPSINDPDVKGLFIELQGDEVHHKDLVQAELDKLPPDSEVDVEDLVDEPVGQ